jgi:diguanylate cyclase (GGDEF)-like protein
MAQHDPLTEVLNRAGFEHFLERTLQNEGGAALAMLYVDLDGFKQINDQHGHAIGDQILKMFADRVVKLVRPTDAVGRLGGDEFGVALAAVREIEHAQVVAEKILLAAQEPYQIGKLLLRVDASIGVALGATIGWRDLVERADVKMLGAKAAGRGRVASERR